MKCPTCQVDLVMSERHGVEIDYCPKCRGVWLDRGELDKIIEKSAVPQALPEPGRHDGLRPGSRYDQGGARGSDRDAQPGRRRKSMFEDIFDF
jgi:Zn-finger nucleic acid-binding protein